MKIYLAGGISGNLNWRWREAMKIYMAGFTGRRWCLSDYLFGRECMGSSKGDSSVPYP